MKTIDVIKYLINEVEQQQALLIEYETAIKEANRKAKELQNADGKYHWVSPNWNGTIPKKHYISSNLRKIRLLALDMLKEVK